MPLIVEKMKKLYCQISYKKTFVLDFIVSGTFTLCLNHAWALNINEYDKGEKICRKTHRYPIVEQCRDPRYEGELQAVRKQRLEYAAKLEQERIQAENKTKERENERRRRSGRSCEKVYQEHYRQSLETATRNGVELWGYQGFRSPQEYAHFRARGFAAMMWQSYECY